MITSSSTGKTATLGSLATFDDEAGQTEIRRENLQRDVAVTGRFEGVSLGKGMQTVQQAVADMHLPPTIRVVYGGTYEEQQKSFRDLLDGAGARDRAGVHGAAVRVPHLRRSDRDSGLGAALDFRRVPRSADHRQRRSTSRRSWA